MDSTERRTIGAVHGFFRVGSQDEGVHRAGGTGSWGDRDDA